MVTHSNILVWLPGKPDGQGNLVSCSPWGLKESGTTEQLMLSLFKVLKWRLKWTLMHLLFAKLHVCSRMNFIKSFPKLYGKLLYGLLLPFLYVSAEKKLYSPN